MESAVARLRFLGPDEGGRRVAPAGPSYSTVGRFAGQSPEAWSLVLDFIDGPDERGEATARIRFLSDQAPAALLQQTSAFELLEGPRVVGRGDVVQPITLRVREASSTLTCEVDDASRALVRQSGGAPGKLSFEVQEARAIFFDRLLSPLSAAQLRAVAEAVTALNEDTLRKLGGVRFVDDPAGALLFEWPAGASTR